MASWEQDLGSGRLQWSHGSARLFGPVAAEAESSIDGFLAIVHQGDRERLRQTLREVAASRGDMEVTFRILDTAGHPRWVRAWGKVIQWRDGHQRLVCIGVDLTQSIELQQALARHTRELARSNEALAQFAYTASHDLQEPLRTVVSFTQLLSKRYAGKLGAEADEFMEFIVSGARRMSRLVGGLLEYSRTAETPPNNDAPVDMEAQLAEVLRALAASIAASGAEITHDPLPKVRGDRTAIAQVLLNLITNAIKYRGDAPPRIHVSSEPAGSDFYTFSIRDNGIGFDPRYRDRIFGVFKRLHATGYEGVGIGLAIAKKAVERHNGRIWAESEPGKGAVFHFTLPSATAMRE
jgi:light-regulated signal transduction histidine kinase (bacteriophytochrome)